MKFFDIQEHPDCETVYLEASTQDVLAAFVDASVPWVWILHHDPEPALRWWKTQVPLNLSGATITGYVRNLSFDLQLATSEFLSRLPDFGTNGLVLIQSHRPMPDTLCLDRIPFEQQNRILIQNGATLRIWLPHSIETGQVQCFRKGYLASIVEAYRESPG